jgi:hypothetical protein
MVGLGMLYRRRRHVSRIRGETLGLNSAQTASVTSLNT